MSKFILQMPFQHVKYINHIQVYTIQILIPQEIFHFLIIPYINLFKRHMPPSKPLSIYTRKSIIFMTLFCFNLSITNTDGISGYPQTKDSSSQKNIESSPFPSPSIQHLQTQLLHLNEITDPNTDQTTNQPIHQEDSHQSHYHTPSDPQFWYNVIIATVFTITGAFCSGMGVGFCNIDKLQLEVMTMSKDPKEKQMAQTIHEVVSNHHLWLTTLLVYNAVALESLPLIIHTLMPDWMAILFSTFIVLIAAQIIPQAVCTGPKKMIIAYYAAPIVNTMRRALFFIIHPIAKGLDKVLGVHNHQRIQHKDFANFLTGNKLLKPTQNILLTSTLELRVQRVLEKMIPIKKLYSLECSEILTKEKAEEMMKKDYSHVLVYKTNKDEIVGVIKVKEFAVKYLRCENKNIKAEQAMDTRTPMLSVYKDTNLLEMLMLFQANSNRIALICDQKRKLASGIPSIMYTKNDMIMKKKGVKIIGAVFLYQIFDELTNYEEKVPKSSAAFQSGEMTEMKELNQPLIDKRNH